MLTDRARDNQQRWRCPIVTGRAPREGDRTKLHPQCRDALGAIGKVTGVTTCETCPGYYLRLPEVQRAATARKWAERGSLETVEPNPSAALIDAINAIDEGLAERERREFEAWQRETDAQNAKLNRTADRPGVGRGEEGDH